MRPGMQALKDRYGFLFWLRWIFLFAGSFIGACLAWTQVFKWMFGTVEGPELTLTWTIATFGSWFLLVIPFMRKKEQIWKRLNDDQERAVDAWLLAMGSFIACLVAAALFWSWRLRDGISRPGMSPTWAKAVFGSWLVVLLPFLVLMYKKADELFKTAEERQLPKFKSVWIDRERRLLPEAAAELLKGQKPTIAEGYLVTLTLKSGLKVPNVFVGRGREILGLYARETLDFDPLDVISLERTPESEFPAFDEAKWLRIDLRPL